MRRLQAHERIDRDVTRRYTVGSRIGRGCYGVVWEVFCKANGGQSGAASRGSVVAASAGAGTRPRAPGAPGDRAPFRTPPTRRRSPCRSFLRRCCRQAFSTEADAQWTYREVSYLLEFKGHRNILEVAEVLYSPDDRHLYMLSQMYASD